MTATAIPFTSSYTTSYQHIKNSPDPFSEGKLSLAIKFERFVLREEVPFECFFSDFSTTSNRVNLKTYLWNIPYTFEGLLKTIMEAAIYTFKKISEKIFSYNFQICSGRHLEVLKAQRNGLYYNMHMFISPNKTMNDLNTDPALIGCAESKMKWGTPYEGKRSFWFIGNYNIEKKTN